MTDDARLAGLKARLAQRAAADLDVLDAFLADPTDERWAQVTAAAHKMAGIAAMLGQERLGLQAQDIEGQAVPDPHSIPLEKYRAELSRVAKPEA